MANAGDDDAEAIAEGRRALRLVAHARRAFVAQGTEEARAYLQARLEVFSKLMFWSFVALLAFITGLYRAYPDIAPAKNTWIFSGAAIGLGIMAVVWRLMLVRRLLSVARLYQIDLMYGITIGCAFGGSAYFARDFRPAAYASLIYASFVVFTRALIVPASGRRSLVVSGLIFVPVIAAGIGIAVQWPPPDLPGPAFAIGGTLFAVVAVLLASIGSSIIYGLRLRVSEAMQLGAYTLGEKIAEGGMGAVYRAQHVLLRRPTAIKLLLPDRVGAENLDRFEREARSTSQLTHPNTVAVYDYGRSPDGVLYYAMEYLDGIDLQRLVMRFGPQPAPRVARILGQVAGALAEAHGLGIVHRDIKPANILLCERGGAVEVVKVVDFGLAMTIAEGGGGVGGGGGGGGGGDGVLQGTPAYLAPEVVNDPTKVGKASDLYALGAVGYFLLKGKPMFEAATVIEVVTAHVTKEVPPLPEGVPAELAAIVMACLAKDPAARPASAAALAVAFEALPRWSAEEARAWWAAYERAPLVTHDTPTQTITIDPGRGRRVTSGSTDRS